MSLADVSFSNVLFPAFIGQDSNSLRKRRFSLPYQARARAMQPLEGTEDKLRTVDENAELLRTHRDYQNLNFICVQKQYPSQSIQKML